MNLAYVHLLVEGALDEPVLRQITKHNSSIEVVACSVKHGKQNLRAQINNYNRAAVSQRFICLVDLDNDECAPSLIRQWLPEGRHPNFLFRVVIREVESWLMADRKNFAEYMGVNFNKIPPYPDSENDPKQLVVNLAKRSKFKRIRQNMIPRENSTSKVGKAYIDELSVFAAKYWNIDAACQNSSSLQRAVMAVKNIITSDEH